MNQIGIYNLPRCAAHPNDKVINLFTKLKRKAKETEIAHQSPTEPNFAELQQEAMNSYRLRPDVIMMEGEFEGV